MIDIRWLLCLLYYGYAITTISGLVLESSVSPSSTASTTSSPHSLFPSMRLIRKRSLRSSSLSDTARGHRRRFSDDDWNDGELQQQDNMSFFQPSRSIERPTETLLGIDPPGLAPNSPKIVVLGATGRIGRLVIRQLLELESSSVEDLTVVAFVRDYDKAIRVLYDDMVYAKANNKRRGPKLQIVEGDLVPPEELPGFDMEDLEDEKEWQNTAKSAAKYFGNKVQDYDNRELLPDINESLEEALKGCTTIISCLGAVRPTNLWTDLLVRPFWRILKADVSKWCDDGRHPYYVHYTSTRKALGFAEREQIRREAAATQALLDDDDNNSNKDGKVISVPKIRFIRISDLSVGQKPWNLGPLVTNMVQSVIFRYHEMADQLLEASSRVETIVLRPGDLVDDDRDVQTTSLQVSHTGQVPYPAIISRDDVASLAVAAALFQTPSRDRDDEDDVGEDITTTSMNNPQEAFHYTLGCRWVGQELDPFPAQGVKADGSPDASTALRRTLKIIEKKERRQRTLQRTKRKTIHGGGGYLKDLSTLSSRASYAAYSRLRKNQRRQPYGICVAVPVYLLLGLLTRSLLSPVIQRIPGGSKFLIQLNEWIWVGISVLMGQLGKILPFLMNARRKQYISF